MKGKTSAKAELRSRMRSALRDLSSDHRISASSKIRAQLNFPAGSKIAIFAGTTTEVQLLDFLSDSSSIEWFLPRVSCESEIEFLPVTNKTQLSKGSFKIMEPPPGVPTDELDVIVCPGLAFTRDGERLGQGGGFYDKTLAKFPLAQKIGVCFDLQLIDEIPTEKHDLKMDRIITPLGEY